MEMMHENFYERKECTQPKLVKCKREVLDRKDISTHLSFPSTKPGGAKPQRMRVQSMKHEGAKGLRM